jgi:hypothetical protein
MELDCNNTCKGLTFVDKWMKKLIEHWFIRTYVVDNGWKAFLIKPSFSMCSWNDIALDFDILHNDIDQKFALTISYSTPLEFEAILSTKWSVYNCAKKHAKCGGSRDNCRGLKHEPTTPTLVPWKKKSRNI